MGDRIRELLEYNDISEEELAELLDVECITVHQWVKGWHRPRADLLFNMAKVFDVSMNYLVFGEEGNEKFDRGVEDYRTIYD